VVYDGQSALEVAQAERPHAVLLDLGMPGMDGYEVARRLRQDAHAQDVRIVALTGWGQEEDRARTRAAGFTFHLTKPVDIAALEHWLTHS
jgi:CheY-like chemotaxis protein